MKSSRSNPDSRFHRPGKMPTLLLLGTLACVSAFSQEHHPVKSDGSSDEESKFPTPTTFQLPAELLDRIPSQRPRLFLKESDFQKIKSGLSTTYARDWNTVKTIADQRLKSGPPGYPGTPDQQSGREQLWQRDVGNALPHLALAWKASGQKKYLEAMEAWAKASCSYPTWGLNEKGGGILDGMDLAASHQLFGLAVAYDWCLGDMSAGTAALIKRTLENRSSAMYAAAVHKQVWWHNAYLQNHLWNNAAGMAAAGFALAHDNPEAPQWIGFALDRINKSISCLGEDGASQEGEPYWEYGMEALFKFMVPAKDLLGVDLFQNNWFRNNTLYVLHMGLPRACRHKIWLT